MNFLHFYQPPRCTKLCQSDENAAVSNSKLNVIPIKIEKINYDKQMMTLSYCHPL